MCEWYFLEYYGTFFSIYYKSIVICSVNMHFYLYFTFVCMYKLMCWVFLFVFRTWDLSYICSNLQ